MSDFGDMGQAALELRRYLRDGAGNVADRTSWNDVPNLSGTTATALLRAAEPGLEWFRLALGRYHHVWNVLRWQLTGFDSIEVPDTVIGGLPVTGLHLSTADPDSAYRTLTELFHQQDGLDTDRLTCVATTLASVVTGTDSHSSLADLTADLGDIADAVPEAWTGPAGTAAHDHLAGFHAHADTRTRYLQEVATALDGLPDTLLGIVREKARFVGGFATPQFPVAAHPMHLTGSSNDPVSLIITVATREPTTETRLDPDIFDDEHLPEACRDWLSTQFGPAVREAVTAFVYQCQLADLSIKAAYQPIVDLLDNHDDRKFPSPAGLLVQPAPTPAALIPGPATVETTILGTRPTLGTSPSDLPPPPRNLPLAGILNTVQSQLTEPGGDHPSATQALGGINLSAALALGGSHPSATLALDGDKISLTPGPDISLLATLTTSDGNSHHYRLAPEDGIPSLTEVPSSPGIPAGAAPDSPSVPADPGNPATTADPDPVDPGSSCAPADSATSPSTPADPAPDTDPPGSSTPEPAQPDPSAPADGGPSGSPHPTSGPSDTPGSSPSQGNPPPTPQPHHPDPGAVLSLADPAAPPLISPNPPTRQDNPSPEPTHPDPGAVLALADPVGPPVDPTGGPVSVPPTGR